MFPTLGIVDLDGVIIEIKVFDTQCHGFAHAQPGPIHELGTEEPGFLESVKKFADFRTTEDGGRALVFPGCQGRLDDEFAMLKDSTVQEDEGVECLFLGGGGDVPVENEVVEEGGNGIGSEGFGRFSGSFEGETEVVGDPLAVCFFGGDSLPGEAKGLTRAVQHVVFDTGWSGFACWRDLGIDGDAFTEEVTVCFWRGLCFESECFPVEGVGPREVEEITSQDSCGLDGLLELPISEVG